MASSDPRPPATQGARQGTPTPAPTLPSHQNRRSASLLGGVAGGLLVLGGAFPLLYAPGYLPGSVPSSSVIASAVVLSIGVGVLVWATVRSNQLRRRAPKGASDRPAGSRSERAVGVAGAAAVALVLVLLSTGSVPGWYLPSSGTTVVPVAGCHQLARIDAPPEFPDGFPPGARVSVLWTSENGTPVRVTFYQTSPSAPAVATSGSRVATESGTYGGTALVGNGGTFWGEASATASCRVSEYVRISWTYALNG